MPRENLLTLLTDYETYARDVAIVQHRGYRRESYTYQKLLQQAANFSLELKSRNIRTGDRVLLWAPNSAEWLVAFWGCLLRGAVVVPMDDTAAPEFAQRVAMQADVRLIVSTPSHPGGIRTSTKASAYGLPSARDFFTISSPSSPW